MNARSTITCRDTTWLVSDSQDRALTVGELSDLREHIMTCPYCSKASVQFDVLFRQLKAYLGNDEDR